MTMTMTTQIADFASPQMAMPGLPRAGEARVRLGPLNARPGQVVQYCGRIRGGPKFGLRGRVVETRPRKAVVDMGANGKWHIPYYMLAVPPQAA